MRVLVEVRPEQRPSVGMAMHAQFAEPPVNLEQLASTGLDVDVEYPPVVVPGARAADGKDTVRFALTADASFRPPDVSALVRGEIPEGDDQAGIIKELNAHPQVSAVYSDPAIAPFLTCGGSPPVGNADDIARKLSVAALAEKGMNGEGVPVAVVDTGINMEHLQKMSHANPLDVAASFTPAGVASLPGQHPVEHGSMCAFDIGIAAPSATLLDHAVLLSTIKGAVVMEGYLSDAVLSFAQLRAHLEAMPEEGRSLVVNNSWGVFDPSWDFPTGSPGNYSDNPSHPFNLIVGSLEAAGADVIFAAGNCGVDCPDGRCNFTERPIGGANSHPDVISVAGMDLNGERVGYSSQGPGRLSKAKPDICSYTHFDGSKVFPVDSGTSAAAPVLAGVVAAVRGKYPGSALSPVQLRALLCKSATDVGGIGFDYDYGWGAINPSALLALLP